MCGIAGFFGAPEGRERLRNVLDCMVGSIRHRGPDEQDMHLEGGVGLGHARLSIIDLSGGAQPMCNDDGSIWVTFNGEIFNYVELKQQLIARGHRFRTQSDTETIIRMYEEAGDRCVEAFNGDFAFALWDKRLDRLLLARDRMGVRPLYYAIHDGALVFGSEIKAILQYPGIRSELDPVAIDQCFTFWFPLAPRTAFRDVQELPPGHILIADGRSGAVYRKAYWQLEYPDRHASLSSDGKLAEELRELLTDATRIRLRADVPVGAYLSGGLDSSIVTALARQFNSNRLRTFSVAFESEEFDESAYQREMVEALRTEHTQVIATPRQIAEDFPQVVQHCERPILRTAPAPLYELAAAVREDGFKVVLTGEGADEVFGGYDIFKEAKVRRFWARQPESTRRPQLLAQLYQYLPGLQAQSPAYLRAFFGRGLSTPNDPLFSHRPRWGMTATAKAFFSEELADALRDYDAIEDLRERLPWGCDRWHPLSQAQYLETAFLLPQYILSAQGDRVAMAHAVEARFPFLDHRVMQFAARIPPRLKLRGLREKHLLRRSMQDLLPPSISDRPKQPYRAPDGQCFFGPDAPEYVQELLSDREIRNAGYFDPDAVRKLLRKCSPDGPPLGFRDNMALVGILSTQLLHHQLVSSSVGDRAEADVVTVQ